MGMGIRSLRLAGVAAGYAAAYNLDHNVFSNKSKDKKLEKTETQLRFLKEAKGAKGDEKTVEDETVFIDEKVERSNKTVKDFNVVTGRNKNKNLG
jgi:hypothetical protein